MDTTSLSRVIAARPHGERHSKPAAWLVEVTIRNQPARPPENALVTLSRVTGGRRSRVIAGRYTLERELGRGGMGAVWLGVDDVLGRKVALKQLKSPAAGGVPTARAAREARLAARLSHPNVVAVFDLVTEGDEPWLVMEYVEGLSLARLVADRGPLSPDDAAAMLAQVADGLRAAHAAGIVHRDVKPSNILVTGDGRAKLTDFGVARGTDSDATLTQTGLVTGSPAYLAPEVATGGTATPASDAWSLGATLFHLVTGRPPYEVADNVLGVLYRIVHDAPPRTDRAGWLTPLLEHTMTHDPARRWDLERIQAFLATGADAAEGTRVMEPVQIEPPPLVQLPGAVTGQGVRRRGVRVRSAHRSPRLLLAVAAVLAVLVVAVVGLLLANRGNDHAPTATAARGSARASHSPSPSARPTSDGVRSFVTNYLTTASSDPASGYTMLTPQFQAESGGLSGYRGFWGHVVKIDHVATISPELGDDLGVSYRYTYTMDNGTTHTEDVHLRLTYDGGRYLIAGD